MNVTVSHIRSALQECYPPREAANLSRIVCCEMLGQSHIDLIITDVRTANFKAIINEIRRKKIMDIFKYFIGSIIFRSGS